MSNHTRKKSLRSEKANEASSFKNELLSFIDNELQLNRRRHHDIVAEVAALQSNVNINQYFAFRDSKNRDLANSLTSAALDQTDTDSICDFFDGKLSTEEFYLQARWTNREFQNEDESDQENDELEFERLFSLGHVTQLARKEHEIVNRIVELEKNGLWNDGKAPEVSKSTWNLSSLPEPQKKKDHFRFLSDELTWLADDFIRERNWKKASAKKLAQACAKVCREKEERAAKAEREEVIRIRRHCASIARMVRDWWRQMDKIVKAKHQVRMAAKRQQAMTSHLGQVLETTEEYTKWLTEGITGKNENNSSSPNQNKVKAKVSQNDSDDEFRPESDLSSGEEIDDEETIAKAEAEEAHDPEEKDLLAKEAEVPIEDLIPPDYFTHEYPLVECTEEPEEKETKKDVDFKAEDSSTDDEATMAEQEKFEEEEYEGPNEKETAELAALEAEADLPIEELLKKFQESAVNEGIDPEKSISASNSSADEADESGSSSNNEDDSSSDESSEDNSDNEAIDDKENLGTVHFLTEDERTALQKDEERKKILAEKDELTRKGEEKIQALTAEALSALPGGTEVSSQLAASVKVPFLLYGQLREYQLIGLNWLATIYEKKLNGILADEMGLGKTIQTIALLGHLACELGIWGPHLIIVPTSVLLNWEMEFKRWCPGFKILTYYGSAKERREKRKGWTKTNAFHVCITSYRLALQDALVFKRKKWRYLILDEAQNIKNFKSQRWQTLLTFNSQRRLLLTGTPLQNSLMELWSLMHFLMPSIFQSHRDFNEWFASPLTDMIEGSNEFNTQLINRLHRVLRPFLLRRLKADVEKQMPKKYEHVIMCRLSRRQRFLYDDFMSWNSTREVLQSGQFLSVMNILMQLRKVCNHPDLFETRPIVSPFLMQGESVSMSFPRLITEASYPFMVPVPGNCSSLSPVGAPNAICYPDLDWIDRAGHVSRVIGQLNNLAEMSRDLPAFVAKRMSKLAPSRPIITEIDGNSYIDSISRDRQRLPPFKETIKNPQNPDKKHPTVLFPRQMVIQLDDELGTHSQVAKYPLLSEPTPFKIKCVGVDPTANSWDAGMPKSVLEKRLEMRKMRLELITRINERRTRPLVTENALSKTTIGDCMGGMCWGDETHLGPDLVNFVTSLTNRLTPNKCKLEPSEMQSSWISFRDARTALARSSLRDPKKVVIPCSHIMTKPLQPVELAGRFDGLDSCLSQPILNKSKDSKSILVPRSINTSALLSHTLGPEFVPAARVSWRWDCNSLRDLLNSPGDRLDQLETTLYNFNFYVPPVLSRKISLEACSSHVVRETANAETRLMELLRPMLPSVCISNELAQREQKMTKFQYRLPQSSICPVPYALSLKAWLMPAPVHDISNCRNFSFPDPRLIQYDCGKLQRLDILLRDLKTHDHRVLIFTQMAKMLDVLEQFLAYHGHRYLRLDGTTKVEQRQVLMERFNQDSKIFVFILSTRSGGLGINLTGADTVIFYDSDWNPTMDAQAQDRCHRIGQTRDVHIYRLISECTIEENILRKANQKRFLSDLAIEKGKFTTAFFKQNTLSELFAEPSGLHDLAENGTKEQETSEQQTIVKTRSGRHINWRANNLGDSEEAKGFTAAQLSAALEQCEDDVDRAAAHRAMEEAQEDADEFSETVQYDDQGQKITDSTQLDPLRRYAEKRLTEKKDVE
ncbi:hypothetical protein Ciccas_008468, partial [Cichlidogyrus casuarinus]